MSLLILVVDDEPDVEALFRQQFRRDIRAGAGSIPEDATSSEMASFPVLLLKAPASQRLPIRHPLACKSRAINRWLVKMPANQHE
jgi:hypothetical protein